MKAFLFLMLFLFIMNNPNEKNESRMERQKRIKAEFIKCIDEIGSAEFKEFVHKNEESLRKAISMNKDKLTKDDIHVINDCRKKAALAIKTEKDTRENL